MDYAGRSGEGLARIGAAERCAISAAALKRTPQRSASHIEALGETTLYINNLLDSPEGVAALRQRPAGSSKTPFLAPGLEALTGGAHNQCHFFLAICFLYFAALRGITAVSTSEYQLLVLLCYK